MLKRKDKRLNKLRWYIYERKIKKSN